MCYLNDVVTSSDELGIDRANSAGTKNHFYHSHKPTQAMLATRASTAKRLARSFATVVDSKASGIKVAAIDNGQPTAAVTFLVKAGSRYEPGPGVAHALKNFAFKVCSTFFAPGACRCSPTPSNVEHGEAVDARNCTRERPLRWCSLHQFVARISCIHLRVPPR